MTTPNTEEQALQAAALPRRRRPPKRLRVGRGKPKSGKKATHAQKRATKPKGAKPAKAAEGTRQGSKAAKVLEQLRRSGGATLKDLTKATGWQPHSVRGFSIGRA